MTAIPYISFNGNCEEALGFYRLVLGGKANILRFKDLPAEEWTMPISDDWKEKVMHCELKLDGGNVIYLSDTWEGHPFTVGTNVTIHLNVDSEKEVYRISEQLCVEGKVSVEPATVFWGSVFASVTDQFGVQWNVEHVLAQ